MKDRSLKLKLSILALFLFIVAAVNSVSAQGFAIDERAVLMEQLREESEGWVKTF